MYWLRVCVVCREREWGGSSVFVQPRILKRFVSVIFSNRREKGGGKRDGGGRERERERERERVADKVKRE